MTRHIPMPAIAAGLLLAGSIPQVSAQNFQVIPNITLPQYAVCLPGFTAAPVTVANNTIYVCTSPRPRCRQGWTPMGERIEDPYHNPYFAYTCVPSNQVIH